MIRLVIVFVLLSVTCATAQTLDQYRWKHRLLLVFADAYGSTEMVRYRATLRESGCELELRDVVTGWFPADAPAQIGKDRVDDEQARSIRGMVDPTEGGVTVVLIGKDGGIKSRYDRAPLPDEIFGLIDSMPMRRAEMRQDAQNGAAGSCARTDRGGEPGVKDREGPTRDRDK